MVKKSKSGVTANLAKPAPRSATTNLSAPRLQSTELALDKSHSCALLLQAGVTYHRAGRVNDAFEKYQQVLAITPGHFDALQLLATLLHQCGDPASAIPLFNQALKIDATNATVFNNRGVSLRALGRFDEALESYAAAIKIAPDNAEAFNNQGNTLKDLGRLKDALKSYSEAIRINPQYAGAFNNRGLTLKALKRYEEALASFDEAIKIKPDYAAALLNQGIILHELERYDQAINRFTQAITIRSEFAEAFFSLGLSLHRLGCFDAALASFEEATRIKPGYVEAIINRGVALQDLRRFDEALESYTEAIKLKADEAVVFYNRGVCFQELRRFDEAAVSYAQAIKIKPDYAEALNNRGVTLKEMACFDEALTCYDEAIKVNLKYADAYYNRGVTLQELKRFDEAIESYAKAISCDPEYVEAFWNQSLLFLLLGDFFQGWRLYEWRLKRQATKPIFSIHNHGQAFSWRGDECIARMRLLLHSEQGLGDTIQFFRFVPQVLALGAEIILQVPKPLTRLFATTNLPVTLIAKDDSPPHFEAYCPLMSLPYTLKTCVETIPADIPYLTADEHKVSEWKKRLGSDERIRVGLVWSGAKDHENDANRSIELDQLLAMLDLPVAWHSLQKEYRESDMQLLKQESRIQRHEVDLHDFADTAALIEALDLVISVDTSVAHLAGAIGKKVWILLPHIPDYRWMLDRDDSPWYPTAKLFRQNETREWRNVLSRVKIELQDLLHP